MLIKKFDEICLPERNVIMYRHAFNSTVQKPDEGIQSYVATLRLLAKKCDFGSLTDELIRDRIVCGIHNDAVRAQLLREKDLTLESASLPKKSPMSCLNDYRPIALTPIMMKCFERLVMHHIKSSLPNTLDPFQFAYRPNRSTDDAISTTLHLALTHLEEKDSYVRMLFIDFSSAFNTIIPQQLI